MRALVVEWSGGVRLREMPEPRWPPGEARVAVRLAGICRTDLELVRGYMNFRGIAGHEFVGVVEDGPPDLLGRRVVGEINAGCGTCPACRSGLERHCPTRTTLGISGRPGAFAERLSLPVENLLPVPDEVSDDEAIFAEPLAAALEILEQVHVPPAHPALVIGDGKLGLLVAQVLARHGCAVTLRGRHERKLALARRWGVTTVLASTVAPEANATADASAGPDPLSQGDSADASDDRMTAPSGSGTDAGPELFPLVVEAAGSPSGFRTALRHIQPRGTLVLKSTYAPTELPPLDAAKIVVDEITIVGSRCGRFAPALRLLARGGVDVRGLVQRCLPFDRGEEALALAARRGALKVLLRW